MSCREGGVIGHNVFIGGGKGSKNILLIIFVIFVDVCGKVFQVGDYSHKFFGLQEFLVAMPLALCYGSCL